MDPAPLDPFHRMLLGRADYSLFLARERASGRPIGTAGSVFFSRSVYLIGAVVLASSRGRGTYRALVSARLRHAAARGVPLATCHARAETSAPILTRLGFTTCCRFRFYLYKYSL
jgi:GNAT superfamily N-acetyltransferase